MAFDPLKQVAYFPDQELKVIPDKSDYLLQNNTL